jgi:TRAP-type C4-dicarboxylate transport system permease small subunit
MNIKNRMWTVFKGFYRVTEVGAWVGYITIACIALIVFVDVCGRYLLNKPLLGSYSLVEGAMVILGGAAIMYTTVERGHVAIDVLAAKFPERTQMIMQRIFSLLGFGVWGMVVYGVYLYALSLVKSAETMMSLPQVSWAPFVFILAAGLFLCSLTLLIQTFHPKVPEETMGKKEEMVNEP